jgi:hypothetical protein
MTPSDGTCVANEGDAIGSRDKRHIENNRQNRSKKNVKKIVTNIVVLDLVFINILRSCQTSDVMYPTSVSFLWKRSYSGTNQLEFFQLSSVQIIVVALNQLFNLE